jgi:hypothetical protein
MKRKIYSLMIAASMIFATSCDLDLLDDPNVVTAATASPDFLLNRIQLDYQGFFNAAGDDGMRLTRMLNQGSAQYEGAYTITATNGYWSSAYANILADIKFLEPLATTANLQRHLGIAKTIKAMVLFHLVDSYGDIPYSQALDPNEFNPGVDAGLSVYQAALASLNEADAHFKATVTSGAPNDYYYARNYTKWIRLVNTLKLRYHLNLKLTKAAESKTAITALLTENNFLKVGDDFVFRFGTTLADPDSRHPRFVGSYTAGGGDYMATYFMWHLTEAKGFDDPRARYYFYRQVTVNPTNPAEIECVNEIAPAAYLIGGFVYCLPGQRGYWGRDHLDPDGIPPDGLKRTVWGLYPAGGRFDNNSAAPVNNPALGAKGEGVHPIMLAAYVDFMLAEAVQTMGVAGNAKALLLSGIKKQMDYVRAFSVASGESGVVSGFSSAADFTRLVDSYLAFVDREFVAAPNKMFIIGREYWIALFGNGVESYNLYRRTGQPEKMQPGLEANPGVFPRSFFYPNNYMVTNTKAVQKADQGERVFWDTNPKGNSWIY